MEKSFSDSQQSRVINPFRTNNIAFQMADSRPRHEDLSQFVKTNQSLNDERISTRFSHKFQPHTNVIDMVVASTLSQAQLAERNQALSRGSKLDLEQMLSIHEKPGSR